ncbi:hypothetical protein L915_04854 [Phytophthora nicotianae]|uniref:Uncharacterized protein n=2 Tax=Phytophthora nicotianae TaxID=4792 RepID=V9FLQ2_PHYNI|nr:hypothetical protein F443_04984 [Phytophthora nicotianae P1569]ETK91610.1 hypothetical protein L915_04854 [Phytophthora nicotianae]ETL27422.1 hypothetical protein L916_19032 [Phytophthora nicotianae]
MKDNSWQIIAAGNAFLVNVHGEVFNSLHASSGTTSENTVIDAPGSCSNTNGEKMIYGAPIQTDVVGVVSSGSFHDQADKGLESGAVHRRLGLCCSASFR